MQQFKRLAAASTALMLTVGCTSATIIRSEPSGANVYIDGSKMGKTPYTYSDTKIIGSTTYLKLKLEGYEEFETVFRRDEEFQVGPCIGGPFLALIPWLWIMGYRPEHVYELTPEAQNNASQARPVETAPGSI